MRNWFKHLPSDIILLLLDGWNHPPGEGKRGVFFFSFSRNIFKQLNKRLRINKRGWSHRKRWVRDCVSKEFTFFFLRRSNDPGDVFFRLSLKSVSFFIQNVTPLSWNVVSSHYEEESDLSLCCLRYETDSVLGVELETSYVGRQLRVRRIGLPQRRLTRTSFHPGWQHHYQANCLSRLNHWEKNSAFSLPLWAFVGHVTYLWPDWWWCCSLVMLSALPPPFIPFLIDFLPLRFCVVGLFVERSEDITGFSSV